MLKTTADYDRYATAFAGRDYDYVFGHFHPDAVLEFAGYRFKGVPAMREFYAFFHAYADERVEVKGFLASDELVMVDGIIHLHFREAIPAEKLAEMGLTRLASLEAGESFSMPQLIAYDLKDGLITRARCAVLDLVVDEIG